MKKRNIFLVPIALMVSLITVYDLTAQESYDGTMDNQVRLMNFFSRVGSQYPPGVVPVDPAKVEGTMYFDKNFHKGRIYQDGKQIAMAEMRYNAYTDEIEIRREGVKNLQALMKDKSIYCEFNNQKIVYAEFTDKKGAKQEGYLTVLHDGDTYQLYHNQIMRFKEGQKAKTSLHLEMPDKFVDRSVFYISRKDEAPVYLNGSKKAVVSFVSPEEQKEVKAYIKEKNLDASKQRDLTYILMYANTVAGS